MITVVLFDGKIFYDYFKNLNKSEFLCSRLGLGPQHDYVALGGLCV